MISRHRTSRILQRYLKAISQRNGVEYQVLSADEVSLSLHKTQINPVTTLAGAVDFGMDTKCHTTLVKNFIPTDEWPNYPLGSSAY